MQPVTRVALPRVGLLGNPSDLFGGRVISFTFDAFAARVTAADAERLVLASCTPAGWSADGLGAAVAELRPRELRGGAELLGAALRRFALHAPEALAGGRGGLRLEFDCDVPLQSGLSGSSAIVVATLRALAAFFDEPLGPFEVAELALAAETEELGLVAGPQDRVVQAYEGLVDMDFSRPRSPDAYTPLDPALLPPLFVAWDPEPGASSHGAHAVVRGRWERGEPEVERAVTRLAELAGEGLVCLRERDGSRLRALVDENQDVRASVWGTGPRDRELVAIGRSAGAGVKLCGSGGAVLGVMEGGGGYDEVREAYAEQGYRVLRPRVARSRERAAIR